MASPEHLGYVAVLGGSVLAVSLGYAAVRDYLDRNGPPKVSIPRIPVALLLGWAVLFGAWFLIFDPCYGYCGRDEREFLLRLGLIPPAVAGVLYLIWRWSTRPGGGRAG